ncbi:beta-N-acetylhexosaminidase [Alkalihalobacillus pseudalcaliphilus]|uniref:beta-N-acetylhexosaminidase n=1 Tax=Alkalihalobacillus pseudalcaliphilus TaxID=79884 RepID=UPI00069FE074|nr:beta-N-acetylhexosaminidase [Alkalihalobacillus pseudalcaliphilus]
MEKWTLKEKIGQMFVIAFAGEEVTPELHEAIVEWNIGGVILFQRNLRDVKKVIRLNRDIQEVAKKHGRPPLWISIDQEGGGISYLWDGMVLSPGNMLIGATGNKAYAYEAAKSMGEQLRNLGFNMNYAPNIDVNNNPNNPVIGARAFGDQADKVSAFGIEAVKGYHEAGILAVAKHFPGHGDTEVDSHLGLPIVDKSIEELEINELLPFKENIDSGLEAIMTAHIVFPQIDPEYPATLSKRILHELLREKYQFDGLIITDSMEMHAISKYVGRELGAVKAIEAGADIILACGKDLASQVAMIERVIDAIEAEELELLIVNQALQRIHYSKEKWLSNILEPSLEKVTLKQTNYQETMKRIAAEGITLQRNPQNLIPFSYNQQIKILSQSTYNDENYMGDRKSLVKEIFAGPQYEVFYLEEANPSQVEVKHFLNSISASDVVVLLINERRKLDRAWIEAYQSIKHVTAQVVVVSLWNPFIDQTYRDIIFDHYLTTYSQTPEVMMTLKELLEGKHVFAGK